MELKVKTPLFGDFDESHTSLTSLAIREKSLSRSLPIPPRSSKRCNTISRIRDDDLSGLSASRRPIAHSFRENHRCVNYRNKAEQWVASSRSFRLAKQPCDRIHQPTG